MIGLFKDKMAPAPMDGGFKMDGYWIWCPAVIKGEDQRYHMFASRWKKTLPMHPGWLLGSEIVRAVSDNPEGPYEFVEVVLASRGPQYWDGRSVHNPTVLKVDDTYVLYYMGTTHPFTEPVDNEKMSLDDPRVIVARSNKRIGLARAKSINGPWTRCDKPVLETKADSFDNFLVSNPAPVVKEDGSVLMIYKSRYYKDDLTEKHLHSQKMSFGVAVSDSYKGSFEQAVDYPIFDPMLDVEDPFIWLEDGIYHMIGKDMDGRICGQPSCGFYACSHDGLKWDVLIGEQSYSKSVVWEDGLIREMGNLERPFILFEEGKATHMFFATSDSTDGQGIMSCTNTWNMVIPLKS